jgi:hypothetical protein
MKNSSSLLIFKFWKYFNNIIFFDLNKIYSYTFDPKIHNIISSFILGANHLMLLKKIVPGQLGWVFQKPISPLDNLIGLSLTPLLLKGVAWQDN